MAITTIWAAPQRIISLAPSLTESLYLLEMDHKLVGCTTYCVKPPAAKQKQKIGTLVKFNLEMIVALKPDLVLAMEFSDAKTMEKLRNLGIRVEQFPSPKNFNVLCQSFIRLGGIVDRETMARAMVEKAKGEVAAIRKRTQSAKQLKIFWQLGAKPLFSATKGYFTNDYIIYSNGINIAGDATSGIFSREEVLRQNPDVIIIVSMGIAVESEKQEWKRFAAINAVRNNRIYVVDSDRYCSPTPPGFVTALKELVASLHPSLETGN